jgi:hypothetical protein
LASGMEIGNKARRLGSLGALSNTEDTEIAA